MEIVQDINKKRKKHSNTKDQIIFKLYKKKERPKFTISKIVEKKLRSCVQCRIKRQVQYTMEHEGVHHYICTDNCLDCFKMEKNNYQITYQPKIRVNSFPGLRHFDRSCKVCSTSGNLRFTWQGMDFCNEICLLAYQMDIGSICLQCTKAVPAAVLGGLCMRFGGDIRQFCSDACLDKQKKTFEMCFYCLQNTLLKPYQLFGSMVKFCSQRCEDSYWTMKKGPFRDNLEQTECRVCRKAHEFFIKYDSPGFPSTYFCTEQCFEDFCQTYNVDAGKCCLCNNFTPTQYLKKYTVFHGRLLYVFCSSVCKNLFLIEDMGVIQCVGCKSEKLSRDAVRKHENLQTIEACSLNCLGLYQAELFSPDALCAYCQRIKPQMFSVTVNETTIHNFCCFLCLERSTNNGTFVEIIELSDDSTENPNEKSSGSDNEHNSNSPSEYYVALPSIENRGFDRATLIKLKKFRPEISAQSGDCNDAITENTNNFEHIDETENHALLEQDYFSKNDVESSFGMDIWLSWRRNRRSRQSTPTSVSDILTLNSQKLDYSLACFVKEINCSEDKDYTPDIIYYMCLGIQKYLYENGLTHNIFNYREYRNFNKSLNDLAAKFTISSTLPPLKVDENHLWDTRQLGDYSPEILTHTLIYFFAKYLKLMTVQNHLGLSLKQVSEEFSPFGSSSPQTITIKLSVLTDHGFDDDVQFILKRNDDIPIRCPINLCRFYLTKCPRNMKKYQQFFYLKPAKTYFGDSRWFSPASLPGGVIQRHLNLVKLVKGIVE